MKPIEPASAAEALDHLVNQFSDPLSFFRELIQNSIDAGTREIDVRFELEGTETNAATMIIHVDDFGEGMDEQIIDTRLTRLFSSSKDGDFTKIGRFGIGFASVFAIEPDAVCVDTSRGGESWRVLFKKDRSFSKIERDEPVEGTKIQIIKEVSQEQYDELRHRARKVVQYWCQHVDVELRFDGERISRPLDLDLPLQVTYDNGATRAVAGYPRTGGSFGGFYNRGLTLLETIPGQYPGVAFKVSSPYLEHTLTRDNVLEDANYHKAMGIVAKLVGETLVDRLFEALDDAHGDNAGAWRKGDVVWMQKLAAWHLEEGTERRRRNGPRKLLKPLRGDSISLKDARDAAARSCFLAAPNRSPLSDALEDEGYVVAAESNADELLKAITRGWVDRAEDRYCLALLDAIAEEDESWRQLEAATETLLKDIGAKVSALRLGRFDYQGSGIAGWPAISQKKAGELTPLAEAQYLGLGLFSRKRTLVVNAEHETVLKLLALAPREPELAALTLVKLFFLGEQLDSELDTKLTQRSVEKRCLRLSS